MRSEGAKLGTHMMNSTARTVVSLFVLIVGATYGLGQSTPQNTPSGPARGRSVPYLGAFLGDVTDDRLAELKLTEIHGAVVGRVVEDSPAAKAGLKVGDVLLTFRGELIEGREHFYRLLTASSPGRMVTLGISRDGGKQDVHVALAERRGAALDEREQLFNEPDEIRRAGEQMVLDAEERRQKGDEKGAAEMASQAAALLKQAEEGRAEVEKQLNSEKSPVGTSRQSSFSFNANRHLLGVTVRPLNAQLASYFGVAGGSGVLVTEVKPGGLVERAGIRAGDCITTLNGAKVSSIQDLTRQIGAVSRSTSSTEVAFSVVRDRTETTVKTSLASR